MKNKTLLAQKHPHPASLSAQQRTGAHCPVSGMWLDQFGGVRYVRKGEIFPATVSGPSDWSLQAADNVALVPAAYISTM